MTYRIPPAALIRAIAILVPLMLFSACRKETESGERKAYTLFLEALDHNAAGDKKTALNLIDSALAMHPADSTRCWLASEKTTALVDLGRLKEATATGKDGIRLAEKTGEKDGLMAMCGALGICYRRLGSLDSALVFYRKGLETAIGNRDAEYEIYLYNCISVLFNEQKRYREALEYSDRAERKALAANDTVERLSARANKGAILMRRGLYRQSVDTLAPLWPLVRKVRYNVLTLKYLSPLLKSYLALGQTDSAMHYMACADEACRELGPTSNGVLGILEIKAQMLERRKRYAEQCALLDSIEKCSSVNMAMPMDKLYATRARCLYRMGKARAAYAEMEKAYRLGDSLKQSGIDRQLSDFSVKYKTLEKEVQIERMNHEQNLLYIRILCLTIALIILSIAVLAILYRRKMEKQRAELTEKTSYINGVETERRRLAKELHDGVCNDILAVNILMQTDREAAQRLLRNVGHDVRRLSHELIPPRFDNATLTELAGTYCQSMSTEDGSPVKLVASSSFEKLNLPGREALEVYRIIQECVSNAVKYGYSKMITVVLDTDGRQASVCIANDISPRHPVMPDKAGIGKDTLKMRTAALGADLRTGTRNGEYRVEVVFPLPQSGSRPLQ